MFKEETQRDSTPGFADKDESIFCSHGKIRGIGCHRVGGYTRRCESGKRSYRLGMMKICGEFEDLEPYLVGKEWECLGCLLTRRKQ